MGLYVWLIDSALARVDIHELLITCTNLFLIGVRKACVAPISLRQPGL